MKLDFTKEELSLLLEMMDALTDGFEYFTEENEDLFDNIQEKLSNALDSE